MIILLGPAGVANLFVSICGVTRLLHSAYYVNGPSVYTLLGTFNESAWECWIHYSFNWIAFAS